MKVFYENSSHLARLLGIEFCCKNVMRAWQSVIFFNIHRKTLCFRERDKVYPLLFCPFCGNPVEHIETERRADFE